MYLPLFQSALTHLRALGMDAAIIPGTPVTAADLDAVDQVTDYPMPEPLRRFYLELGSGFRFEPDQRDFSGLWGWDPMWLDDHRISNTDFHFQVEDDVSNHPRVTKDERFEAIVADRKRWVSFYFGGDGCRLCLDPAGAVRYYQVIWWPGLPDTWDFRLADSFDDFMERWSRYHFISPEGREWTSFCYDRCGSFDWAPEHFPVPAARS